MFWRRNGEMGEPLLNLNIINSFDVDMFCVATDIMLDGARAFVNECYFVLLCVCVPMEAKVFTSLLWCAHIAVAQASNCVCSALHEGIDKTCLYCLSMGVVVVVA